MIVPPRPPSRRRCDKVHANRAERNDNFETRPALVIAGHFLFRLLTCRARGGSGHLHGGRKSPTALRQGHGFCRANAILDRLPEIALAVLSRSVERADDGFRFLRVAQGEFLHGFP